MKSSKRIPLLVISLLLVCVFFFLPQNRKWVQKTVLSYGSDFIRQKDKPGIEERRRERYGQAYIQSVNIAGFFRGSRDTALLVLIPPETYFSKHNIIYPVPEPAVFYYYTGLKTTWAKSPAARRANWYACVRDGKIVVDSVHSQQELLDSIASFNKFPYPL